MSWLDALGLGLKIRAAWQAVKNQAVGVTGSLPAIRLRIGRGYWELGPFPVRRVE